MLAVMVTDREKGKQAQGVGSECAVGGADLVCWQSSVHHHSLAQHPCS